MTAVGVDVVSLARARDVVLALATARIREERDLTVQGIVRWAIEPASYTAVYLLLFGLLLHRDRFAYPLFLLCALIPFRYLTGVWLSSMSVVVAHTALITNHLFPRKILPIVPALTEAANLAVASLLVVPLLVWYTIVPGPELVALLPVVLALLLLAVGPGLILAVVGLRFRESRALVANGVRLSFFVSSALVGLDEIDEPLYRLLLRVNPMTGIFESIRAVVVDGRLPATADLLYPILVGAVLVVVGLAVYNRYEPSFAKRV